MDSLTAKAGCPTTRPSCMRHAPSDMHSFLCGSSSSDMRSTGTVGDEYHFVLVCPEFSR